jgi:excisionase family DNA binding protein
VDHGVEDPAIESLIAEVRDESDQLSVEEAAAIIQRSAREVRRLAKAGTVRSVRVQGENGMLEYRFRRTDLENYQPGRRGRRWPAK